jgi:transcriptional regulator with PAS, ATPase and Fis domain
LLRALEERVIKRVGSQQPIDLDVRVVAATNRDLRQAVNRGSFRSDLYYRLDIMRLRIPPLRERREDIRMLVAQFFHELSGDTSQGPPKSLVETLERHDWPGNVRELRSAVERAVITGDPAMWAGLMDSSPVAPAAGSDPYQFDPSSSFRDAKALATVGWERWYITELMARNDNNLSKAARAAKMDRSYLRQLVKRYLKDDHST